MRPPMIKPRTKSRWCWCRNDETVLCKVCPRVSPRRCFSCGAFSILMLLFVFLPLWYRHQTHGLDPCLVLEQKAPRVQNSKLPKVIHQQWPKGKPMPPHTTKWFNKWNELFPDVEHRLWSDEELRALISKDFPWFLETYDSFPLNIMRIDAARTFILYSFVCRYGL
jgi:Glycosyltransferase sugar-binding region containing DXD motif